MTSVPSDEELMQRYRAGELDALRSLFVGHAQKLQAFFFCMLGNSVQAEDLCQKTWLRLHEMRKSYAADQQFIPWFYGLAMQLCRDFRRTKRVRVSHPGVAREVTDAASLVRALRDLPDNYREAVVLKQMLGVGSQDLAHILGATESAVKQRVEQGEIQLSRLVIRAKLQILTADTEDKAQAAQAVLTPELINRAIEPAALEHNARALLLAAARDLSPQNSSWPIFAVSIFLAVIAVLLWIQLVH